MLRFTVDDLNALFRHPILLETGLEERLYPRKHSPQTALMWVPAIALFSGMREDEICGLRVTDVREEDGVLYFNVVEHEGRSVKSEAAIIAPPLPPLSKRSCKSAPNMDMEERLPPGSFENGF